MKINVFLLVCVVVLESLSDVATALNKFDPELRYSYRDPEHKYQDLVHGREYWKRVSGVEYGNLVGGHSEFPWVVHIKSYNNTIRGDEWYSIGNLISYKHVLTVCRAVTQYRCSDTRSKTCPTEADCPCGAYGRKKDRIELIPPNLLWIYWFPTSQWHEHLVLFDAELKFPDRPLVNGRQPLIKTVVHPYCEWDEKLSYDMAVGIMESGIPSLTKFASVMPTLRDRENYVFDDPRLPFINDRRVICYVASLQYNMTGFPILRNYFFDFKVKYRVYPYPWERCEEELQHICRGDACTNYIPSWPPKDLRIECWQTRSNYTTVCDHDRGAPVVCDGKVQGIVLRGARSAYCNPAIRMPFMMQRIVREYPQFLGSGVFGPFQWFDDILKPSPYDRREYFGGRRAPHSSEVKNSSSPLLIFLLSLFFSYYE